MYIIIHVQTFIVILLLFLQSVNAKPKEVYFRKANCNDDWYARNSSLACSKQIGSDGEDVWDSQVCTLKGETLPIIYSIPTVGILL